MAKAKSKSTLGLKARPSALTVKAARKAGFKGKEPKKAGAAKTEASALRYASNWNTWVDRIHEKAKEQAGKEAAKKKLQNFRVAVSGL